MGNSRRILIAGESWVTHSIHQKGFDSFTTTAYYEGVGPLREALESRRGPGRLHAQSCGRDRVPGNGGGAGCLRRGHPQRHRRQHAAAPPGYLRAVSPQAGPTHGHP